VDSDRCHPSDRRIRDIALRWGFWHMWDFGMRYRKEFGELPSDTLLH